MKSPSRLLLVGLTMLASLLSTGCQPDGPSLIRVEEFGVYSQNRQDGEAVYNGSRDHILRRKVRIYQFTFCEKVRSYTRFERDVRPRYQYSRGYIGRRPKSNSSTEDWEYLCEFDLNRNRDQMPIWLNEIRAQYAHDQEKYRRWIHISYDSRDRSRRRSNAIEVRAYWCGGSSPQLRTFFLHELLKRLGPIFPNEYTSYKPKIERAVSSLHTFCDAGGNEKSKIREVSTHWNAVMQEVFRLPI